LAEKPSTIYFVAVVLTFQPRANLPISDSLRGLKLVYFYDKPFL